MSSKLLEKYNKQFKERYSIDTAGKNKEVGSNLEPLE